MNLAERRPIGLAPEQILIASVRDFVIDHCGDRVAAVGFVVDAEPVLQQGEPHLGDSAPLPGITTGALARWSGRLSPLKRNELADGGMCCLFPKRTQ